MSTVQRGRRIAVTLERGVRRRFAPPRPEFDHSRPVKRREAPLNAPVQRRRGSAVRCNRLILIEASPSEAVLKIR